MENSVKNLNSKDRNHLFLYRNFKCILMKESHGENHILLDEDTTEFGIDCGALTIPKW